MREIKAVLNKDHLYKEVYDYKGHEIWLIERNEMGKGKYSYYIDGNTLVSKGDMLPWFPRLQTKEEAIKHGEKRIDNLSIEQGFLRHFE